ncbi:MAG: hypothetical protein FJ117_22475 [Deltaproteobacteria bacterium]|nr:hypothetical protein [Deltaproteobacteria bacterium]
MIKKELGFFFGGIILLSLLFQAGCAGSKTYLLNLSYDTSKTVPFLAGASEPVNLALYNFQDTRPDRLYLGRRVYRDGMVDFFKADAGTVEQVVTKSIAKMLEKAGFKVTLVNRFLDPSKEDFKDIPADVAFGGSIEALWVEGKSGLATTDTNARMNIRVNWGLVKERTWITKTIEGSAQESDRPLYQPKHAEALINDVFKDGVNKLLKDEIQLKEKLLKAK